MQRNRWRRNRRFAVGAFCAAVLAVTILCPGPVTAQPRAADRPAAGSSIPDSEIASLRTALPERGNGATSVSLRRAYKNLARKAGQLLERYPTAPNRFDVLAIMFQGQKRLLGLENTERNRDALFETCAKLADAPDAYAEIRLEADALLSERDLARRNADLAERADALAELVRRYRGTPAEARSLMMAALIAPKIEAYDLERSVLQAMDERFAGDPDVIEFRRKHLGISKLDVLFTGTYTRADGTELRLPIDRLGRQGIMVFWSRRRPGFEAYLKRIQAEQDRLPGRFEVFSFNLDELPDAGASALRALGLDWTVMRLPGGRRSQAFRTYAGKDPVGVVVNAFGRAMLTPTMLDAGTQAKLGVRGAAMPLTTLERRFNGPRYLAQLQSMLVGDFLVMEPDGPLDATCPPELRMTGAKLATGAPARPPRPASSVPIETLRSIQACFTPAPFRYRLTTGEALANYRKAETLCTEALRQHPAAPDLWIVRNRRIIALLGMWNLAGEPRYLQQAAREARAALAGPLDRGAEVVGRFCLAKEAIRRGDRPPATILSAFLEQAGGPDAPGSALAAAAILALDANARHLHERYRDALLARPDVENPLLWSVVSFLRDRYHRFRLLRASHIRHELGSVYGSIRGYIVAHGETSPMGRLPKVEFKTLDGQRLELPRATAGRLTLLLFIEPPADEAKTELPLAVARTVQCATDLASSHVNKEVTVIAAFLCDDPKRVDALMKANGWTCRAAMVPGGLANPLVRRLGIVSADRMANVFLLRRDGTVQWHISGFRYDDFGFPFAAYLAMKVHIEVCDIEVAYAALEQGEYRKALRYFVTCFDPEGDQRYRWAAPRLHGRALAEMGLKQYQAALADIDAAIETHQRHFNRGRACSCDIIAEMQQTRAAILDHLGRSAEAGAARQRAAGPVTSHGETPYGRFHEKLKRFRLTRLSAKELNQ